MIIHVFESGLKDNDDHTLKCQNEGLGKLSVVQGFSIKAKGFQNGVIRAVSLELSCFASRPGILFSSMVLLILQACI